MACNGASREPLPVPIVPSRIPLGNETLSDSRTGFHQPPVLCAAYTEAIFLHRVYGRNFITGLPQRQLCKLPFFLGNYEIILDILTLAR